MSDEELMLQHLSWIRSFADVISLDNWRDMRDHIERQFREMEALRTPATNADDR